MIVHLFNSVREKEEERELVHSYSPNTCNDPIPEPKQRNTQIPSGLPYGWQKSDNLNYLSWFPQRVWTSRKRDTRAELGIEARYSMQLRSILTIQTLLRKVMLNLSNTSEILRTSTSTCIICWQYYLVS